MNETIGLGGCTNTWHDSAHSIGSTCPECSGGLWAFDPLEQPHPGESRLVKMDLSEKARCILAVEKLERERFETWFARVNPRSAEIPEIEPYVKEVAWRAWHARSFGRKGE